MPAEQNQPVSMDIINPTSSPFDGVITLQVDLDTWIMHPTMQQLRNRADRRCAEAGICNHDIQHSIRATNNGLAILTMFQRSILSPLISNINPIDIAFVMQTHDLGYGEHLEVLESKYVNGHERKSWELVENTIHNLPHNHPTRTYFEEHHALFSMGIVGTEKDPREIIKNFLEQPTPNNLFLLLIAAAGKADYFIRQRVELLPPPKDIISNPYHVLAFAVDTYQLTCDEKAKTLTYSVQIVEDNSLIDQPRKWLEMVKEHYNPVLELLKITAQLAGYTLVVEVITE